MIRQPERRRFFYHFNKPQKRMSVHFKNVCFIVDDVKCYVPCETKWNKRQPLLVMQGRAAQVEVVCTDENRTVAHIW